MFKREKKTKPAPWVAMKGGLKPAERAEEPPRRNGTSYALRAKPIERKKRVNPISEKHKAELAIYNKRVKEWKKGKRCGCIGMKGTDGKLICSSLRHPCEDNHHRKGRGPYLMDEKFWLPVCRQAHLWIDNHRAESYELGLLLIRGK